RGAGAAVVSAHLRTGVRGFARRDPSPTRALLRGAQPPSWRAARPRLALVKRKEPRQLAACCRGSPPWKVCCIVRDATLLPFLRVTRDPLVLGVAASRA